MTVYFHKTRRGIFYIRPRAGGGWQIWFGDEALDPHSSPASAAHELANGYGVWPSFGSPEGLGIPEDIGEWAVLTR